MADKLFPDDEGTLEAACFIKDDQVVIAFGKSVKWLSLGKAEAEEFIKVLQKKVAQL